MAESSLRFADCVSCHSWNKDGSLVAYSPNSSEVMIASAKGETKWSMRDHDQVITAVDWAPNSNLIVTCSQDRNAYVWTFDEAEQKWNPTLVILRINRAATDVKWSPSEKKFAVASGAKLVSICYFDDDNDFYIAKHIKKPLKSTILSVAWHPEGVHLATGTADFKCRIFSAFVKSLDKKAGPSNWGEPGAFGDVVAEIDVGSGWVHSVAFSPSGDNLAIATHNSSMCLAAPGQETQVIKHSDLPFRTCLFLSEDQVVAAGYDNQPYLFKKTGDKWAFAAKLDAKKKAAGPAKTGTRAAFAMFQNTARTGATGGKATETNLETTHQNAITSITALKKDAAGKVTSFSTSGYDGRIVVWSVKTLADQIDELTL
eukprot:TRINITY_DN591_c0_g2_i7.p1 TRINITY_DN591_c0_g2~~TRINITY_DN591_c0_g2_i7.p1  ORF type:complete len:372 (-),score=147.25 TRINITY_DN591_c0_g2_i7:42-1157(-)